MFKILPFAIAVFATVPLHAAPLPPTARAEVDALLNRLQSSACRFNRNGSWHDAAAARVHLLRKLDYLQDKNMVASAEQFIERGASTSSSSSKPYLVQCGQGQAQPSGPWLLNELKAIRGSAPAVSASAR